MRDCLNGALHNKTLASICFRGATVPENRQAPRSLLLLGRDWNINTNERRESLLI